MAGRGATPFGDEVRSLVRSELEAGENPTWKSIGDKVKKIAATHKDKREEKKLEAAFSQIKNNLKKQLGKPTAGKKRGRPAGSAKVASTNGHEIGNGLDLAINYAKAAGGLDKAIATLNQLKAIKESL
ncbi:MAG: hypothetical protein K2X93_29615 [Candidatus Obscuribacterales bacterium]|nr:hypothetical protein [Candidatus Obscuribacterales bacterium]